MINAVNVVQVAGSFPSRPAASMRNGAPLGKRVTYRRHVSQRGGSQNSGTSLFMHAELARTSFPSFQCIHRLKPSLAGVQTCISPTESKLNPKCSQRAGEHRSVI